jgi:hypothetical protein
MADDLGVGRASLSVEIKNVRRAYGEFFLKERVIINLILKD